MGADLYHLARHEAEQGYGRACALVDELTELLREARRALAAPGTGLDADILKAIEKAKKFREGSLSPSPAGGSS